MLESKLWYIMTVTKNVNSTKMVGFIKACDQKPYKFNFVHFFSSLSTFAVSPTPFPQAERPSFEKKYAWGKLVISLCR